MARLVVAFGFGLVLAAAVLVTAPVVSSDGVSAAHLAAGAGAHVLTVLAGVSVGALCSRPIVTRTAWAVIAV